jgi:LDH2 family malate/lactate/ureidoglycolate dehydrogenase
VPRYLASDLDDLCRAVVRGLGAPEPTAAAVAASLVEADARGVATHGLVRLPSYAAQVRSGEIDVAAEPHVDRDGGATALVDGELAFGARTATFAMTLAIERSQQHGVGVVAARRCTHFGTAAHYALMAARTGLVGIAATNTPAVMAPFGATEAVIGNNPLAVAAPLPDGRDPFVLDMAQTVVARGRIKLAETRRDAIPEDWALDPDGQATTDPALALAGALLPFGGYKGSGLALAVEALTGVLAGAGLGPELLNTSMTGPTVARPDRAVGSVGSFFLALDPEAFVGREAFARRLAVVVDAVRAAPPRPGVAEVLAPGDLEARAARDAAAGGVALAPSTVEALEGLAREHDAELPRAVA